MTQPDVRRRIQYIDGLRAIAVLAVLVFHLDIAGVLPNGFLGVDVFFVISGFVITRSLLTHGEPQRILPFLEQFYRRRFWRLLPPLAVVVAVTLVVTSLVVPAVWISRHILFTGIGAVTGTSNLVLTIASGSGYFDRESDFNPFLHTWSLGVEEQFYLFYPVIFWVVAYFARRGSHSWSRWIIPVLGLLSFGLALWLTSASPTFAFYMLPTRFWELAAGAIAFQLVDLAQKRVPPGALRAAIGWIALVVVVASFLGPEGWASPLPAGIAPVFGTVLLLWFAPGVGRWSTADRWLGTRPMAYIGRISYSLYLWHWPVIVLMRWTTGISDPILILTAVVLTFVLAAASYHGIERPIQRAPFARWALPSVAFVLVGVLALGGAAATLRYGVSKDFVRFLPSTSVITTEPGWQATDLPGEGGFVVPEVDDPDRPELLVVGDSHAGAYQGAATLVANQLDLRVRVSALPGCGFTLFGPIDLEGACRQQVADLEALSAGDVVLFGALRVPRYVDMDGSEQDEYDADSADAVSARAEALAQLEDVVADLESRGVSVIVDSPKPLFEYIPLRCADWYNQNNPVCSGRTEIPKAELLERARPTAEQIAKLAEDTDVVVWDVFDVLCPGTTCAIFDAEGHTRYFDQDHLSGWGNELVAPSLREAVLAAQASRG